MFVTLNTHQMVDAHGQRPVRPVLVNYRQITYMLRGTAQKYLDNKQKPLKDIEQTEVTFVYLNGPHESNFVIVDETPDEIIKLVGLVIR